MVDRPGKSLTVLLASLVLATLTLVSTASATSWEGERPLSQVTFDQRAEIRDTNSSASVGLSVLADQYDPRGAASGSATEDRLQLYLAASANTRKSIVYSADHDDSEGYFSFKWLSESHEELQLDDDEIYCRWTKWQTTAVGFRFFGGPGWPASEPGTAEYERVCISSNGFLTFDWEAGSAPNPTSAIPDPMGPNAVIAPHWADLDPTVSGSIQIYDLSGDPLNPDFSHRFAVTWENVYDKTCQETVTFQVQLELTVNRSAGSRYQDTVWFLYDNVDCYQHTVRGIEDQEGRRGLATSRLAAKEVIEITSQVAHVPGVKEVTLEVQTDANARLTWDTDPAYVVGEHIEGASSGSPAEPDRVARALEGQAGFLTAAGDGTGSAAYGGRIWRVPYSLYLDRFLIPANLSEYADSLHQVTQVEERVHAPVGGQGRITVIGCNFGHVNDVYCPTYRPVDTALVTRAFWWFSDDPKVGGTHTLTVTVKITYRMYPSGTGEISESTTLTLRRDAGDSASSARSIDPGPLSQAFETTAYLGYEAGWVDWRDYYSFHVDCGKRIEARLTRHAASGDFRLRLYDAYLNVVQESGGGGTPMQWLFHIVDHPVEEGTYYLEAYRNDGRSLYDVKVWLASTSCQTGGGGGGSPFVAPWNGTGYEVDNNILPLSEVFDREELDTEDHYRLHVPLVAKEGVYSLQLTEFEEEHSFLDSADLRVVDHDPDAMIGVHHQTGDILTFEDPEPANAAVDNYGRDALQALLAWDGATYEGWHGDNVVLEFGRVLAADARLVIVADPGHIQMKTRILVEYWNGTAWQWIDSLHHRRNFAYDVVDLSPVLPNTDLKVRLVGISQFSLEQVGIDTSPQKPFTVVEAPLLGALHSSGQDMTRQLSSREASYAEMEPGEHILVNFSMPARSGQDVDRSFVLVSYGHYTHTYQPFQGTDVTIDGLSTNFKAIIPEAPLGQYWNVKIETLEWEMGDGATYAGPVVSHTYATSGEYLVTVKITYGDGHVKWYERRVLLL